MGDRGKETEKAVDHEAARILARIRCVYTSVQVYQVIHFSVDVGC